jgi:hypothetical protein
MPERLRLAALGLLAATLAGCAGGGAAVPIPSASRPAADTLPRPARVQPGADTARVIGLDAAALRARYGEPRIDLVEGDARKLQFAGDDCVVDIYLYPAGAGEPPVAAHVDARLREGGLEIARDTCLAAIEDAR